MVSRCFKFVNEDGAEFPIITNDHERGETCGQPRGGRGRGRGRGSPGEASRTATPNSDRSGRGRGNAFRGAGSAFRVADVVNAVEAAAERDRHVRPRLDDAGRMEE